MDEKFSREPVKARFLANGKSVTPSVANRIAWIVAIATGAVAGSFLLPNSRAHAETMAQAMAHAYHNNPQLRAARAALRSVDEQAAQAFSNWLPRLSISADAGRAFTRQKREYLTERTRFETDHRLPAGASLNLRQNAFRGGRYLYQWRRAKYNIFAQRARLAHVEQVVLLNVVRAYMAVFRDRTELQLNRNNENVLARQLQAARDRFSVGEVTRTDVSQAQARLARARAATIQAMGNLQASQASYVSVVGHLPNQLNPPKLSFDLPEDTDAITQRARQDNPQVLAALWAERSAREAVRMVAGELLPTVTLNGQVQRRFDQLRRSTVNDSASITANMTIPLYQSGAVMSRMRSAKQIVFQRLDELRQAQRTAVENATRSHAALRTARSSVQAFMAQLQSSRIALNGVREEAAAGLRTILDTLNAQQELLNAQVNLVRARRNLTVATYELLTTMGRMNARKLGLRVKHYDPDQHYREVRHKAFGFGKSPPPSSGTEK